MTQVPVVVYGAWSRAHELGKMKVAQKHYLPYGLLAGEITAKKYDEVVSYLIQDNWQPGDLILLSEEAKSLFEGRAESIFLNHLKRRLSAVKC